MNVKGTALTTTRDFVRKTFPDKYNQWLNCLPAKSKEFYASSIDATKWYPLKEGYLQAIECVIRQFYKGDAKTGAEAIGRYSAEMALTGFYKVFLLIASPKFLMQRASKIFSTFYDPSEIVVVEEDSNHATLKIVKFDEIDLALEYRIAGWIKKALELANCKNPEYTFGKMLSKGNDCTEIKFGWS
ncbi:MAG: hypothetical protein JXB00_12445 [Bacteroidales bacterium]|nr:hypothetical protein [Bacteroidales bacterium]